MRRVPDIRFYCGINESDWSHHPTAPGKYACIAPVYGRTKRSKVINAVSVPAETQIIIDSGAFSDRVGKRLSFEQAFFRQVAHAYRFGYVWQVSHIASYDCLIDQKRLVRHPGARWTRSGTSRAVTETIEAAAYVTNLRRTICDIFMHPVGLILTAQGIDAAQYLACAKQIVPMIQKRDILGLGGFAATGLFPGKLLPPFREIARKVVPYAGRQGVKRIHIWGVCMASALAELLYLCDQHHIALSTDSSGPQRRPLWGEWGYASWRNNSYTIPPILEGCRAVDAFGKSAPNCAPDTRCRGLERARHVRLTRKWLAAFREREIALYVTLRKKETC